MSMGLWVTAVFLSVSLSLPLVGLGLFVAAWRRDTLSERLAYVATAAPVRNRLALLVVLGVTAFLAAGIVGVLADPGWISLGDAAAASGPLFMLGSLAFYVAVVIGLNPSRLTDKERSVLAGANMYVVSEMADPGGSEPSAFPEGPDDDRSSVR